jgi:hypothetical protein
MRTNHALIKRVLESGARVCEISHPDKPDRKAAIWALSSSRGYQTGYTSKRFFYLVKFEIKADGLAIAESIGGITKDSRRHTMQTYWRDNGFKALIFNADMFAEYLA